MVDPRADSDLFRSLLSCFATGVTVATTLDAGGRACGMTASAVSAVSLQPPLLLICVNREAKLHAALARGARFALNVLAAGQEKISQTFASGTDDPFDAIEYRVASEGLPLVDGVVAHIICEPWGSYEAGDHTVFFGRVVGGEVFQRRPLVHYRSQYTTTQQSDS